MRRYVLLIGLLVGGLALLVWQPGWLAALRQAFSADTIAGVAAYLRGFGIWTPLASLLLMLLQSVIAPLPGSLVAAANGVVFGIYWGSLLSWAGGLLGGTASFWIARLLGQRVAARLAGASFARVARISERDGFWYILVARLIPLISFDFISYLAGLSRIRYPQFLLATAIGMLPGTIAWTVLGYDLALAQRATWRLGLVGLVAATSALGGRWWLKRRQT